MARDPLPLLSVAVFLAASPADAARDVLVELRSQVDLGSLPAPSDRFERAVTLFDRARDVAATGQADLTGLLDERGVGYQTFWIRSLVAIPDADEALVRELARRADVARVHDDVRLSRSRPEIRPDAREDDGGGRRAVEWNIAHVGAPEVWATVTRGEGAVVGGIDTGVDWDHPALIEQYRGWNGTTADHDHAWHDAIHDPTSTGCPPDSPEPCDVSGHGTHTLGTIVGDDGASNQVGVAPGAEWIACRCWESVEGTALRYVIECLEWMVAPTDLAGANPDPARAPHVISNSWICEPHEGCTDPDALLDVVAAVRAAGIVVVAGAGNDGPACSSIDDPPAIYDASLTIGATDDRDEIAPFSSRGPITVNGSDRLKPDLTAPGVFIRSAVPGGGYQGGWNGTSMATPHVAGAVALMVAANPSLAGDVNTLEELLRSTAVPLTTAQSCGGVSGLEVPNPITGHGRLDVVAAVDAALAITGVGDAAAPARPVHLARVVPDPVHDRAQLAYEVFVAGPVEISVYDVAGRRRLHLDRTHHLPGRHRRSLDLGDPDADVTPGVYFVRVEHGEHASTRRITVVR